MGKGEAAQAVEVSAYPDRYDNYSACRRVTILDALLGTDTGPAAGDAPEAVPAVAGVTESSRVVFPLPEGTWTPTSPYGPRTHPITGDQSFHTGSDFSAADGTPILAAADGTVTVAEYTGGYGGLVVIEHTIRRRHGGDRVRRTSWEARHPRLRGRPCDRRPAHRRRRLKRHVHGAAPALRGPHEGGTDGDYTDPAAWLNAHDAADLPEAETGPPSGDCDGCDTESPGGEPEPVPGENPDELVDDPTTGGQITRPHPAPLSTQASAAFPDTTWACYSPRPRSVSEHPLGRACDIAFGNAIGQLPTPAQHEARLGGHELAADPRRDPRGRVPDLASQDLVPGSRRVRAGATTTAAACTTPTPSTGGHRDHLHVTIADSGGGCVMDVFPDFDGLAGIGDLVRGRSARLLMFVLIIAVLMLIVSGIAWAIGALTGNYQVASKGRVGVLVALGAAILAGSGVAWINWLDRARRTALTRFTPPPRLRPPSADSSRGGRFLVLAGRGAPGDRTIFPSSSRGVLP
jgi:hypothetical protein